MFPRRCDSAPQTHGPHSLSECECGISTPDSAATAFDLNNSTQQTQGFHGKVFQSFSCRGLGRLSCPPTALRCLRVPASFLQYFSSICACHASEEKVCELRQANVPVVSQLSLSTKQGIPVLTAAIPRAGAEDCCVHNPLSP